MDLTTQAYCLPGFDTEQDAEDAIDTWQEVMVIAGSVEFDGWSCAACSGPGCDSALQYIDEWDAITYVVEELDGSWTACVEYDEGEMALTCSLCPL